MSMWGNTYYEISRFGELLSQPGKDLVARFEQVLGRRGVHGDFLIGNMSKPANYYRMSDTDYGGGRGLLGCDLDVLPDDKGELPVFVRDSNRRRYVRADVAFHADVHWSSGREDQVLKDLNEPGLGDFARLPSVPLQMDPGDEDEHQLGFHEFDVVFSTSRLQWEQDHEQEIDLLMLQVSRGGYLCVTLPRIESNELFWQLEVYEIEAYSGFGPDRVACPVAEAPQRLHSLSAGEYAKILSGHSDKFWIWETTYHHLIPGAHSVEEWYDRAGIEQFLEYMENNGYGCVSAELMKEEVFKWLYAGNPTPVGDGLLLSYPFISFIARNG